MASRPVGSQKLLSGLSENKFKTSDMRAMLRDLHPTGEWALMEEVAPRTGGGTRYADGIAVNLWKSRGYAVHGFEIKVSRADWMRELKNPAKADELFGYCDHWWVVAAPGIVKPEELPAGWGLMEPVRRRGKAAGSKEQETGEEGSPEAAQDKPLDLPALFKLTPVVRAGKLDAKHISREFFASLVRRSHEVIDRIAQEKSWDAVRKVEATISERVEAEIARRSKRFQQIEEQIKAFEQETGLKVSPWTGPPAEIIQLAVQLEKFKGYGTRQELFSNLTKMAETLEKSAQDVREAVLKMSEQISPADGETIISRANSDLSSLQ